MEAKLEYVASRVWSLADLFRSKARSNKKWAFRLKLLTALCSAAIPVVLGLKFENASPTTQHNIALVLGGVVALVATIDAFWGHRQLWVTYTTTATELQNLGCRMAYETNGTAVTEERVDEWYEKFHSILEGVSDQWEGVRSADLKQQQKPPSTQGAPANKALQATR